MRYTDNGIRLKHSVGERERRWRERERPLLFVTPPVLSFSHPPKNCFLKKKKKKITTAIEDNASGRQKNTASRRLGGWSSEAREAKSK